MKTLVTVVLFLISTPIFTQPSVNSDEVYVCVPCNSNCDTLEFSKPGTCNHCGMKLITNEERQAKYKNVKKKFNITFKRQMKFHNKCKHSKSKKKLI